MRNIEANKISLHLNSPQHKINQLNKSVINQLKEKFEVIN
jgi:hypothetical protein